MDIFAYVYPLDDEQAQEYWVSLTIVLHVGCKKADVEQLTDAFRPHIEALNQQDNRLCMLQANGEAGEHGNLTNTNLVCLPSDFSFEDANCMRRLTLDFLCWD